MESKSGSSSEAEVEMGVKNDGPGSGVSSSVFPEEQLKPQTTTTTEKTLEDSEGKVIHLGSAETTELRTDLSADLLMKTKPVRIYMSIIWLIVTAVMILFCVQIVQQFLSSLAAPSSTVLFSTPGTLPLPKLAVCNWNQNGIVGAPIPTGPCPQCLVALSYCLDLNTTGDCTSLWVHQPIPTFAGLFDCWVFNGDPNNILASKTTGYGGGFATVWEVQLFEPLNATAGGARAGLQASFLLNDGTTIDPLVIYNEVNFAPVGQDTFFALQLVSTVHSEKDTSDPLYNVTRFETGISAVSLLSIPTNSSYANIGISFSYQSLSKQEILFSIAYTINNLFGDFAGMIGTLMGLDAIKVSSSIPLFFLAYKLKTFNPLEDHFNG